MLCLIDNLQFFFLYYTADAMPVQLDKGIHLSCPKMMRKRRGFMQVLTNLKLINFMEQGMFGWGGPKRVVGLGCSHRRKNSDFQILVPKIAYINWKFTIIGNIFWFSLPTRGANPSPPPPVVLSGGGKFGPTPWRKPRGGRQDCHLISNNLSWNSLSTILRGVTVISVHDLHSPARQCE